MDNSRLPAWLTPESQYKGLRNLRFRNWRNLMGGEYAEDFFVYATALQTLVHQQTAILNFPIQRDAAFEWIATTVSGGLAAGPLSPNPDVTLQIIDGGANRNFFNIPTAATCIAGSGQLPHILPIPRRFMAAQLVNVIANSLDSAIDITNFQVAFIGRKIFSDNASKNVMGPQIQRLTTWRGADGKVYAEDYFAYSIFLTSLAAAAVSNQVITTDGDSDFELVQMSVASLRNTTTGAAESKDSLQVLLNDGSSQRNLYSNPTMGPACIGSGQLPFILPETRIFEAKTPINLTITNNDTVTLNQIFVTLEGRKIFEMF